MSVKQPDNFVPVAPPPPPHFSLLVRQPIHLVRAWGPRPEISCRRCLTVRAEDARHRAPDLPRLLVGSCGDDGQGCRMTRIHQTQRPASFLGGSRSIRRILTGQRPTTQQLLSCVPVAAGRRKCRCASRGQLSLCRCLAYLGSISRN
ncbi:hypothetical protein IF1G_01647 [Cordyceps javanica]|uniref:Uncharacterized protein n=1 Tax=Cordyceps javanica TaxID=43265 RepID=A0A545VCG9_9HYPO|nr:hypothetical protein IF1G_01647 [Cordyceps javanica]